MGLFSKSKEESEHQDATDIKQATISDSQKSSIENNPVQNTQDEPVPSPYPSQANQPNFVNPFSGQNSNQQQAASQNPFEMQSSGNNQGANPVAQPQNDSMGNLNSMQPQQNDAVDFDKIQEMIDETVEKIIEEKWNTLEDKVNKVLRWKEAKDSEINMLKEDLVALADGFNKLEMKLINKISNYDKNIMDVNSEIKALEKVFQKVTPTLINNVNELSKIADEFKGIEPKKRKVMTEEDFKVEQENEAQNEANSKVRKQ